MTVNEDKLNQLAQKLGIQLSFTDFGTGITYTADTKSKQVICASLGYTAHNDTAIDISLQRLYEKEWLSVLSPSCVVYEDEVQPLIFEMSLPLKYEHDNILFQVQKEDGSMDLGSFWFHDMPYIDSTTIKDVPYQKRRVYLFINAPLGYHKMVFQLSDGVTHQMHLIVVPRQCYQPAFSAEQKKVYGFPVQLYALKSKKNWGIGDYSDLKSFCEISSRCGAGVIGINPLSALFPDAPQDASPYSSCSRLFFNPIYVDLTVLPEFSENIDCQQKLADETFLNLLTEMRNNPMVQYKDVFELKNTVMREIYQTFKVNNFENGQPITQRGQAYIDFCTAKGESLTRFATYQVLRLHFSKEGKSVEWSKWRTGYQNPTSALVKKFQTEYAEEIDFIKYQQFISFEQYDDIVATVKNLNLSVGLYTDFPVGVSENSAEVWSDQFLFMRGVTTGAPPDSFNRKGQDWGLAPFNMNVLAETGFAYYRQVVAQAMYGAGAVRVDHAFGLDRLYLRVPKASGAYITHPFKALMGIIALESHRQKCLVIAEDLGTAPAGFSDKMLSSATLSFKILHFGRWGENFIAPKGHPYYSLIATGTHDMPSYSAYWKGLDLDLGLRLGTLSQKLYQIQRKARKSDKECFIRTFKSLDYPITEIKGRLTADSQTVPDWFIKNAYRYLSEASSQVLMVRLEDIFEQDEQINLPGTCFEYPNWRYKLPVCVEEIENDKRFKEICAIVSVERKG